MPQTSGQGFGLYTAAGAQAPTIQYTPQNYGVQNGPTIVPTPMPNDPWGSPNPAQKPGYYTYGSASIPGGFASASTRDTTAQTGDEKYRVTRNPLYQSGLGLYANAQDAGLAGMQAFNRSDQQVQAGIAAQQALVAPSAAEQQAMAQQTSAGRLLAQAAGGSSASLDMLRAAASGQGPQAGTQAAQAGLDQAAAAERAAAASTRGGAYAQAAAQQQAGRTIAGLQSQAAGAAALQQAQQQAAAQQTYASMQAAMQGQAQGAAAQQSAAANAQNALNQQAATGATSAISADQLAQMNAVQTLQNMYQNQGNTLTGLASNQIANDYGLAGTALQTGTQQYIANQQFGTQLAGAALQGVGGAIGVAGNSLGRSPASSQSYGGESPLGQETYGSTGAASAAAKGARDQGAGAAQAAQIGTSVGHRVGRERFGDALSPEAQAADARAAEATAEQPSHGRSKPMSLEEARAYLARLRGSASAIEQRIPPDARYEPAAPAAYMAGSALAQVAKKFGGGKP